MTPAAQKSRQRPALRDFRLQARSCPAPAPDRKPRTASLTGKRGRPKAASRFTSISLLKSGEATRSWARLPEADKEEAREAERDHRPSREFRDRRRNLSLAAVEQRGPGAQYAPSLKGHRERAAIRHRSREVDGVAAEWA